MIKSMLLATDLSQRSVAALDRALLLAQGAPERIGFLHVIDSDVSIALTYGEESATPPAMAELLDARLAPAAPRPDILIRRGDPYEAILAAAETRGDELIVMGLPRPRRFLDRLRGTTLERVIRASTRPVLSVRTPAKRRYGHVMIATDLSRTSALALTSARRLGLLDGARVTVIHAHWSMVPRVVGNGAMTTEDMKRDTAVERVAALKDLRTFLRGLATDQRQMESLVVMGTPQSALPAAVADLRPDLVVMGTRGRSGAIRLALGSVAEDLMAQISVDVLAVPPAAQD
ncbi:MAG: universal stress protein [Pseudorhodobacter sp.]|nr:universal stress protein [Pseudorhodobacter sp.]